VIKVRVGKKLAIKQISGEHSHELSEVRINRNQRDHVYMCVYTNVGNISSYAKTKAS